jgi:hypothetical protein
MLGIVTAACHKKITELLNDYESVKLVGMASFISSVFCRLNNKQICLVTLQSYKKIAVTQNVTAIDLEDVGDIT